MDIENKIEEDRIVTIEKEPEVGDLVRSHRKYVGHYQDLETGVVLETWESVKMFDGEDYPPYALVHWTKTDDEEEHIYEDLEVISA